MAASIPWYARIAAKMVLKVLPVPYSVWKKIGIYSHGEMQNADYALQVFDKHLVASGFDGRPGITGLEMVPGDSIGSAIIAKARGFCRFFSSTQAIMPTARSKLTGI